MFPSFALVKAARSKPWRLGLYSCNLTQTVDETLFFTTSHHHPTTTRLFPLKLTIHLMSMYVYSRHEMVDCLVFPATFVNPLKPYNEHDVNRLRAALVKRWTWRGSRTITLFTEFLAECFQVPVKLCPRPPRSMRLGDKLARTTWPKTHRIFGIMRSRDMSTFWFATAFAKQGGYSKSEGSWRIVLKTWWLMCFSSSQTSSMSSPWITSTTASQIQFRKWLWDSSFVT